MPFWAGSTLFEEHTHPSGLIVPADLDPALYARITRLETRDGARTPAAAFPATANDGDLFYETDTDKLWVYDLALVGWVELVRSGAWTSYAPTNVNVSVNNGTQSAFWTRMGRTIHVVYTLTFGSTSSFVGNVRIGLPVAGVGHGVAAIDYEGARVWVGSGIFGSASNLELHHTEAGNNGLVDATNPFTFATGNRVRFSFTYEAAASA